MKDIVYWRMHVGIVSRSIHQYESFQFTSSLIIVIKIDYSRQITSIIYRFKLNGFRTKYSKHIKCICGAQLTTNHILYQCQSLRSYLPMMVCNPAFSNITPQKSYVIIG